MGCDIHCYIEHKQYDSWWLFGGRINPGRCYYFFTLVAGVRGDKSECLFPVRGMPSDADWQTKADNTTYVTELGSDEPYSVSKKNAEEWVAAGYSKWVDTDHVTQPDWHSHSWVTGDEWAKAIKEYEKSGYKMNAEYYVMREILREFKKQGQECRVVFWFDN